MSEIKYTHEEVVLGALLHDVGKVVSRLRGAYYYDKDENNVYKYSHAKITHDFLNQQLVIRDVPNIFWPNVATLAAKHHSPDETDVVQKLIQTADHLSAGADRGEKVPSQGARLTALFSKNNKTISLRETSKFTKDCFPMFPDEKDDDGFESVLNEHVTHLSKLLSGSKNARLVIECVDWFAKNFMSCTPADMRKSCTISLYDHCKTTAAIASALYRSTDAFTMIIGGVDGIQNFISRVEGTKKAASGLRGRSFYLQMLTEQIKNRLLLDIGLYSPNTILNAAGKFWILAPSGENTQKVVEQVAGEVERHLAKTFACQLSFNLTTVSLQTADLSHTLFKKTREKIMSAMETAEATPFSRVLEDHYIVSGRSTAAGIESCISCKQAPRENEGELCSVCRAIIELGTQLRDADFLVWKDRDLAESPLHLFAGSPVPVLEKGDAKKYFENKGLYSVETLTFEKNQDDPARLILPHRVVGRYVPPDDLDRLGDSLYLASMKADVDSLGDLFERYGTESLSAATTFSRIIDFFFSDYLQWEFEHNTKFKNDIYTVFSGGDDLFVIGDLRKIMELSFYIREQFAKYADNPDVHFSAGISVHHRKYPVKFMIEQVEEELKKAKQGNKNALSFQGDAMDWGKAEEWNRFFDRVERIRSELPADDDNSSGKLFWRRILMSAEEMRRMKTSQSKNLNDLLYDAHLKYYVARNINEGAKGEIGKLRDEILSVPSGPFLNKAYNAVRLAIWLAREKEER